MENYVLLATLLENQDDLENPKIIDVLTYHKNLVEISQQLKIYENLDREIVFSIADWNSGKILLTAFLQKFD